MEPDQILPSPEAAMTSDDDWLSLPTAAILKEGEDGGVGVDLAERLSAAQTALEDKEFKMLEMQATHAKQLRDLRRQLDASDAKARELQTENSRLMRQGLASDEEKAALEKQIDLLKLKLQTASLDSMQPGGPGSAIHSVTQLKRKEAALAEAETKVSRLTTALQAKTEEAAQLREELNGKLSSLVSRDSEMEEFRARATQQEARIRALHDQLASFIEKDAHEAARAQIAEQDLEETRKELAKRLGQLKKVVAALNAVRQKEASLAAALDAQTELAGQLQARCSALVEEAARALESKELFEQQYQKALEEVEKLSDRIDELEKDAEAKKAVVDAAINAAERIEMMTKALKAAGEERGQLLDALSNAKADARRETLALQRLADDRQAIIRGLQADLAAATSALSAASGANRAAATATTFAGAFGPNASGHESSRGAAAAAAAATTADSLMLGGGGGGGGSSARGVRPSGGVGSTGGKPIVLRTLPLHQTRSSHNEGGEDTGETPSSHHFVKGPPGAILSDTGLAVEAAVASEAECVKLRLQVDSLSRKVKATEERLAAAQRDQEQLLVVNEKLRVTLEKGGGGSAATALALTMAKSAAGSSSVANIITGGASDDLVRTLASCFVRYVHQVQGFAEALRRLLASLHGLRESCRNALEGGGGKSAAPALFGLEDLREEEDQRRAGRGAAALPMLELERALASFLSAVDATASGEAVTKAILAAGSGTSSSPSSSLSLLQLRLVAMPEAVSVLQQESVATDDLRAAVEERVASSVVNDACATQ